MAGELSKPNLSEEGALEPAAAAPPLGPLALMVTELLRL